MQASEQDHHEREHFFGAAKAVAGMTMTSRILGLVRDMVLIPIGGPKLADAFWTAFSIPHLFRRLFGEGALSAAFVPVFTGVVEESGWDRARAVLANVSGILALVLAGLVVVGEIALWACGVLWPGDWAPERLLQFAAIMLPFMFTVCLLALGSAALNCKGHFAYPAAAPILLNIGLIVTAWWIAPAVSNAAATQFLVIATGLVVTGIVQLVGVIWLLKRSGLAVLPRLRPVLGETRAIAAHMLPMLVPLSLLQFSAFADRLIALIFTTVGQNPPLEAGVVRCLYAANRLYQLPLGVLAISIATVVFPLFSRYAARNDTAGLRDTTNRALRLCIFLGLPAAVGLIILAEPLVTVIFERGGFKQHTDTGRAAFILQMYCLGMVAYFCNHILLRAFFSRGETSAPLRIACILAGVNVVLVIGGILFTPLKGGAIGLATAVTATANTVALTLVLRRRLERIGLPQILTSLARIAAAAAVMAVAVWAVVYFCPAVADGMSRKSAAIVVTGTGVIAGAGVYLLAAIVCRCPELGELLGALRKKPPVEQ